MKVRPEPALAPLFRVQPTRKVSSSDDDGERHERRRRKNPDTQHTEPGKAPRQPGPNHIDDYA